MNCMRYAVIVPARPRSHFLFEMYFTPSSVLKFRVKSISIIRYACDYSLVHICYNFFFLAQHHRVIHQHHPHTRLRVPVTPPHHPVTAQQVPATVLQVPVTRQAAHSTRLRVQTTRHRVRHTVRHHRDTVPLVRSTVLHRLTTLLQVHNTGM